MMSKRRLGALVAFELVVLLVLLTIAFDQYVHAQVQMVDGLNRWGYRGAVAKRRVYDETRIMMIGGSRAFEPGVPLEQTALARIRFRVQEWVTHDRGPVTAINLGLVDLPRGAYASRLEQHRYLEPDVICVYAEFSPAKAAPPSSLTMRITGYLPAAGALAAIDRGLGSMFAIAATDDVTDVADALAVSLAMAPTVVVLPQPGSEDEERSRKALLASFDRFAGEKRLKLVQLSGDAATGDQIEPAVSEFLRMRTASAAAR